MTIFSSLRTVLEAGAVLVAVLLGGRLVLGLLGRRPRVYQATAARQLRLLFWPLLCLGVGLPLLGGVLVQALGAGAPAGYELALGAGLGAVVLGFAGPALLLHARYYALNHRTRVVFEPRQNQLEVYQGPTPQPFAYHDLLRVEYVTCRSNRLFWSPYTYLRLHLRGGQVLTLTSLLLPLGPVAEFLRSTPLIHRRRWLCWP